MRISGDTVTYQSLEYSDAAAPCTSAYLPTEVFSLGGELRSGPRVLDVGCGNGFLAGIFLSRHCKVTGIDLSRTGIEIARLTHPRGRFEVMFAGCQGKGQVVHPLPDGRAEPNVGPVSCAQSLDHFGPRSVVLESRDGVVRCVAVGQDGPVRADHRDPCERVAAEFAHHGLDLLR